MCKEQEELTKENICIRGIHGSSEWPECVVLWDSNCVYWSTNYLTDLPYNFECNIFSHKLSLSKENSK